MDVEFPRFFFSAERVGKSQVVVRARYSWNGVKADGNLPEFFNTFTAILEAIEVRLLSEKGVVLAERRFQLERYGMNYGGYLFSQDKQCNVKRFPPDAGSDFYFEYDVTLKAPLSIPEGSSVEVRAIGNYE